MDRNGVILIPIKEHARAKSRMEPLLTLEERAALSWAMFEDMIAALRRVSWPVVVVTCSEQVRLRVEPLGWEILGESQQLSESDSVDASSRQLACRGVRAILRLPADLPLIRAADVEELLALQVTEPGAVLVPSRSRSGTNALLRTPPDIFPSFFGPDSFSRHVRAAARAGAALTVVENARLALDLDDAADLAHFLAAPEENQTYRTLMTFNIRERLACHAAQRDSHPGFAGNS